MPHLWHIFILLKPERGKILTQRLNSHAYSFFYLNFFTMPNYHSSVLHWPYLLVTQGPASRSMVPTSQLMYVGVKKSTFRKGPVPAGWWMSSGGWFCFHYSDQANSEGFWECELYLLLQHAVNPRLLHHPIRSVLFTELFPAWRGLQQLILHTSRALQNHN